MEQTKKQLFKLTGVDVTIAKARSKRTRVAQSIPSESTRMANFKECFIFHAATYGSYAVFRFLPTGDVSPHASSGHTVSYITCKHALLLMPFCCTVLVPIVVGAQICVRDLSKKRSFELEGHTTMVTDYDGER